MKPSMPFRHIAVEGPIGVGKTSLVQLLAERFEGVMVLEDITNPFLPSFYEGRPGAAFQVQIYFLLSRFQQQREIAQMDLFHSVVLADYTFQKDRIFAYLNLDDDDLAVYEKLYPVLEQEVPKPDLVLYMQASVPVLLERIRRRGREYESGIDAGYLKRLSEAYSYYFFHYRETPLLVVNTNSIDFVHDTADLDALIDQIARCRRGTQVYVPLGSKRTETLPGTEGDAP